MPARAVECAGRTKATVGEADERHDRRRDGEIEEADARGPISRRRRPRAGWSRCRSASSCRRGARRRRAASAPSTSATPRVAAMAVMIGRNITTTGVSLTTALVTMAANRTRTTAPMPAPSAEAGEHRRRPLQRVGLEQALADDQHGEDGDQRVVGEAGEDLGRWSSGLSMPKSFGTSQNSDQPADQRGDRDHLDRPALERIGGDHGDDRREGQPHQDDRGPSRPSAPPRAHHACRCRARGDLKPPLCGSRNVGITASQADQRARN